MAKILLVLYLVAAALCSATMSMAAPIIPVSLKLLNEIQSNRTIPTPWVIRFAAPGGQTDKEKQAFSDAAMLVDRSVAQFGVFTVDTYDKARMVETMGIRHLPATRYVQFKTTRPTGPKTSLSGRPLFMQIDLPASATSEDIVRHALIHTAMRYHHPVTTQVIPTVTYVLTPSDLSDRAKLTLPGVAGDARQNTLSNVAGGNDAMAVIFYFHLMLKNHLSYHAEINSLAARMGPRLTVFATEDAEVAKMFGLTSTFSAAAFRLKDVNFEKIAADAAAADGVYGGAANKKNTGAIKYPETVRTVAIADELANAGDLAGFGEEHTTMSVAEYNKILDTELQRWHKDTAAYYNRSPLIKISHSTQFKRDVMANKASITILFMLREADRLFNKYHRTAIEFATFVRDPYRVAPGIYGKMHPNLNLQTFWIDGEVQSKASQFLATKTVPSIAFIMHASSGQTAVKYFAYNEEDKKRRKKLGKDMEWPDVQDLMAYVASEQLLQNAPGMSAFSEEDVQFNDDVAGDGPASATAVDHNHRYLYVDRKQYHIGEEKASEFLMELSAGKITVDADHYAKEGADGKDGKKKSKKASAKEEARKAKLQADLEQKRKEREERTKAKEAEDKVRREAEAAKTKAAITKKAKAAKKKSKDGKPVPRVSVEGESISAPPLQPGRFKKDWNLWKKDWENDKRKMTDKFVKNVKGGIRVGKGLGVPDWKKPMPTK